MQFNKIIVVNLADLFKYFYHDSFSYFDLVAYLDPANHCLTS